MMIAIILKEKNEDEDENEDADEDEDKHCQRHNGPSQALLL